MKNEERELTKAIIGFIVIAVIFFIACCVEAHELASY